MSAIPSRQDQVILRCFGNPPLASDVGIMREAATLVIGGFDSSQINEYESKFPDALEALHKIIVDVALGQLSGSTTRVRASYVFLGVERTVPILSAAAETALDEGRLKRGDVAWRFLRDVVDGTIGTSGQGGLPEFIRRAREALEQPAPTPGAKAESKAKTPKSENKPHACEWGRQCERIAGAKNWDDKGAALARLVGGDWKGETVRKWFTNKRRPQYSCELHKEWKKRHPEKKP